MHPETNWNFTILPISRVLCIYSEVPKCVIQFGTQVYLFLNDSKKLLEIRSELVSIKTITCIVQHSDRTRVPDIHSLWQVLLW